MTSATRVALLAVLAFSAPGAEARQTGEGLPGSPKAHQALALCQRADAVPLALREAILTRGLDLAQAAVEADDGDAAAHFAVFCNLGKRLRLSGPSLRRLAEVRRLRHEIDRTLELAPDDPDALLGKGAMLLQAPRVLGGDPAAGARLIERARAVGAPRELVAQAAE